MTSLIAMKPFQETFGTQTTGPTVAVIFSMMTVGSACASPVAAPIADRYGRKMAMGVGSVIVLAGMLITSTSSTVAQITVGRWVLGFGGGMSMSLYSFPPGMTHPAEAIYQAPSLRVPTVSRSRRLNWRGRCGGMYMTGWFVGAIPAAAVCFGDELPDQRLLVPNPSYPPSIRCHAIVILDLVHPRIA